MCVGAMTWYWLKNLHVETDILPISYEVPKSEPDEEESPRNPQHQRTVTKW